MCISIEYDDEKNIRNIKKHGISFQDAAYVFNDKHRIEYYDIQHSFAEDRYITIGMVDTVLFVVYTERKNKIRLISARIANKKEQEEYYDSYHYYH